MQSNVGAHMPILFNKFRSGYSHLDCNNLEPAWLIVIQISVLQFGYGQQMLQHS